MISHRTAFLVLALDTIVAGGCDSHSGETPLFPVRLLPPRESGQAQPLFEWKDFQTGDLADWLILSRDEDGPVLLDAAADERAIVSSGQLQLRHPEGVLVRLIVMPAQRRLQLRVELDPGGEDLTGGNCGRFALVPLDRLSKGQSPAELLGRGKPLAARLERAISEQLEQPLQRWYSAPDADGLAGAQADFETTGPGELWALAFIADQVPARVGSIRCGHRPDTKTYMVQMDRSPETSATVLFGVLHPSVFIPAGESVTLQERIPATAEQLSFHLGLDPEAEPGTEVVWTAEVETRSGRFEQAGGGTLTARRRHVRVAFEDFAVPWPEVRGLDRPQVRFRVNGGAGLFLGQPMVRGPARDARPNLLLISLDTLRADHLGCYGYERPTSPFIDQWSRSAAVFLDHRGVAPYTLPTHATMFTGLMPKRHGATWSSDRLDASRTPVLAELLAGAGYVTAAFASGGFLSHDFGFSAGFDRFSMVDPILSVDDALSSASRGIRRERSLHNIDAAAAWIEAHARERWFLFLHSFVIHEYLAPEEDLALFRVASDEVVGADPTKYLKREGWIDDPPPPETIAHLRDRYDATIHFADRMLRRLFERLDASGSLDNTVVVITSDHGEEFFEHGNLMHSTTLYEEMLNVPLIIRLQGGQAGRVIEEPVSQADLTPTLLDLLGLPPLESTDGHSRAGMVRGASGPGPMTPLYAEVNTSQSRRSSLRVGPLKVIHGDTSSAVLRPAPARWQLFDLEQDPGEAHDLTEKFPDRFQQLREDLLRYESFLEARAQKGSRAEISPELLRRLEELGY